MSEVQFLPGGGALVPAGATIAGDGQTTIAYGGQGGGVISTDLSSAKSPDIAAILAAGTLPVGTPIYPTSASPPKFDLAVADTEAHACVVGLLVEGVTVGESCTFRDRGLMSLTVAEWNAVVVGATTGLTPQTYYFLSATGKPLTATAPSTTNDYVVRLGFALTATVFKVDIGLQGVVGGIP